MKKIVKNILNASLMTLTAGVFIAVTVVAMGPLENMVDTFVFPAQTKAIGEASIKDESLKTPDDVAKRVQEEGTVLLTNNDILPIDFNQEIKDKDGKPTINVFGWSSTQWVGGGSGSGQVVAPDKKKTVPVGLIQALDEAGFSTNSDLIDFYKNYRNNRPYLGSGSLYSHPYQFESLIEPSMDEYGLDLLRNAENFSDTALVCIGRVGGENHDEPKVQYKGNDLSSTIDDKDRTYLDISTEEEQLIKYCAETYANCIVIVNSTNPINLSFLQHMDGVDKEDIGACLFVGGTGTSAARAIPDILSGKVNPSGKLADTYAYDFKSNPSYVNAGMNGQGVYTNGAGCFPSGSGKGLGQPGYNYPGVSYIDYCENIYVGYRYYETADAENIFSDVSNVYGKGYNGVVQFPFGYGLSYTDFDWKLKSISVENGDKWQEQDISKLSAKDKLDKYMVTVEVTNTGNVKGKDVVQLYYQPPYTKGGIEKADTNLLAFEKTEMLEPKQSCEVNLTFSLEDMDSYDCYDKNKDGHTGYELEKGTYNLQLKTDAHTLKTMKSEKDLNVVPIKVDQTYTYDTDTITGKTVNNKFTGDSALDGVSLDGSDSGANITFLSRSDLKGTFPSEKKANREMTQNVRDCCNYTKEMAIAEIDPNDGEVTFGVDSGLKVCDNPNSDPNPNELGKKLGADYNDPQWDKLLDQLSFQDAVRLTLNAYVHTEKIDSIGKPRLTDFDGPCQIESYNAPKPGVGYPTSTILAQTFNKPLAKLFGQTLGQEARERGVTGWYGPATNMHRSPFGGRNYEYYSEDPLLAGLTCAYTLKGSNSVGVYSYLKHFAVNDQDWNKEGLCTFLTEQTLREIYLKPFKLAIQVGNCTGLMSSHNRIAGKWAGGSKGMMSGVLRDEWDFKGVVISDYVNYTSLQRPDEAIRRGGGDLWMRGGSFSSYAYESNSNTFKKHLKESCKHILYSWLNVNVEREDSVKYITKNAPWRPVLLAADGVAGVGIATWAFFIFAFPAIKSKCNSKNSKEGGLDDGGNNITPSNETNTQSLQNQEMNVSNSIDNDVRDDKCVSDVENETFTKTDDVQLGNPSLNVTQAENELESNVPTSSPNAESANPLVVYNQVDNPIDAEDVTNTFDGKITSASASSNNATIYPQESSIIKYERKISKQKDIINKQQAELESLKATNKELTKHLKDLEKALKFITKENKE